MVIQTPDVTIFPYLVELHLGSQGRKFFGIPVFHAICLS
uniref:Uncharacterized protein n=1 Tax=Sphenodon punctatus TaxID=8508 RepID=A0A8D0HGK4_SPHPU